MPPTKNVSLLRTLLVKAEALAGAVSKNEFPVLLRPLSERRRVTSVDFCPLLVDAMLTTHPNGFRILLNSGGGRAQELKERYCNESKGRILPSRLRFSIAHELAHTFFYDLKGESPKLSKKFTSGGGKTELENLERHCNTIASHLLLPTQMLAAEFLKIKTVTPESILELAQTTGVSPQALLFRLDKSDSLFIRKYFRGCVVLVEQHDEELKVRAIAKPRSLMIARQLLQMRSNDLWNLKAHDGYEINPIRLPKSSTAVLEVALNQSKCLKEYRICVAEAGSYEATNSFLLTFEEK
jgi:Zn-dependent peptidase ImmA (M78 family)